MSKRVAILQSNYIPWKGYFDFIDSVDEFIIYDAMQYTRRDWRNRNKIKGKDGLRWLSVPVQVKGKYLQRIDETAIQGTSWIDEHLTALAHSYARAPFYREVSGWIESIYRTAPDTTISAVNRHFLASICDRLGITTPIVSCDRYEIVDGKTERLVSLCLQAGATEYVSGPAAREYIDPVLFHDAGITLSYKAYSGYPEYPQVFPPFEHGVTVFDLLAHTNDRAMEFARSVPRVETAAPSLEP